MNAFFLLAFIVGGTALLSWPLGGYLKWAMDPNPMTGGWSERFDRLFGRLGGRFTHEPQNWKQYVFSMLIFNALMFTVSFGFMAAQPYLPLNPEAKGALAPDCIFNTAASFTSNTNLQHYSGEVSMSYLSQLCALMWLQFVSAATGIAALAALARGLAGRKKMGNFFLDLQRATFLVLLPMAFLVAVFFVLGGMPMTFHGAAQAITMEGLPQTIARGPVAAFVAIKQLGTNGGGFFGPNSTHPYENPTFWTNLIETISLILIPMGCVWMFGRIVGRIRHAAIVFGVMLALLLFKTSAAIYFEQAPTQAFANLPIEQSVGNLEGKELRFGSASGALWAVLTTCTSNGSVNAMHDSLNPLTGLILMAGMWLNTTFGGVGVGMINMVLYVVLAVFVAGMMIGRSPELFGRRIEAKEVKLVVIALFTHALFVLAPTALFAATDWGAKTLNNTGPHGFSEILYEFSSANANNGSGFEGLGDNTIPWNIATGIIMLLARFIPIILPLALAGSLAAKPAMAQSAGTLGVEDGAFGAMLLVIIVFIGALTFLPVAALGPIAEHLLCIK
jgi:K+-transporting ATPase ATPase A chain